MMRIFVKLSLFCLYVGVVRAQEDNLNRCMKSNNHKDSPSSEESLSGICEPWKDKSCCTREVANYSTFEGFENIYNFTYNHCPDIKNMSDKCREAFQLNNCFYECSPNLGPWLTEANNADREERFENVRLCKNECETWLDACKDDYTCMKNWRVGWNWTTGTNQCPENAECKKFSEIFTNPEELCNIYPGDYKVVDGNECCMVFNFTSEESNPNNEVAKNYTMGLCGGANNIVASQSLEVLFLALGALYYCILK